VEGVVGDESFPHEIPDRFDRLGREPATGRVVKGGEERRAFCFEMGDDRVFANAQV
jgi:hypothetical protein